MPRFSRADAARFHQFLRTHYFDIIGQDEPNYPKDFINQIISAWQNDNDLTPCRRTLKYYVHNLHIEIVQQRHRIRQLEQRIFDNERRIAEIELALQAED